MKTFTIDSENNITVFGSSEEAAAGTAAPFDSFATEKELADLVAGWPAERIIDTWNSLAGVRPVKSLKSATTAAHRIWQRIQSLGGTDKSETEPARPKADKKAKRGAQAQGRAREGEDGQEGHRR